MKQTITIPYEIAKIIRNVFLPQNPNKLRNAHPATIAAAKYFIKELESGAASSSERETLTINHTTTQKE